MNDAVMYTVAAIALTGAVVYLAVGYYQVGREIALAYRARMAAIEKRVAFLERVLHITEGR
jgi:hypothetical protein